MIKNLKSLKFILSVSLSIALTIIISIFITTAQTPQPQTNSYLADDLQVKTGAKFNASGSSQVIIDTFGNVKASGLCIGSDCKTSWYTAGTGISISGTTITNSGDTSTSDDITSLTAGTGISISGTGNTRTITNSATDTNSFGGIYQKYYYYSTYKSCIYKNPITNDCSCPSGFSNSIFADLYGEGIAGAHYYLYQCYK